MSEAVPYCSVTPRAISMYYIWQGRRSSQYNIDRISDSKEFNKTQGIISDRAKKKIENAVDWLLFLADDKQTLNRKKGKLFKFKSAFITLTLSSKQIHSDNEIKSQLLNQFLIEARKRWKINNYVWRAESQYNGNIHFHILVDKFIPWFEIRSTWNRIQNKLGYVDRYHKNMKKFHGAGFTARYDLVENIYHRGRLVRKGWTIENQRKAYKQGIESSWYDPNSTDIHSVRLINDLGRYISKICSQNLEPAGKELSKKFNTLKFDQEESVNFREIDGKLWGLSTFLSKCRKLVIEVCNELDNELQMIKEKFHNRICEYDYATVIYIKIDQWSNHIKSLLWDHLFKFVQSLTNTDKLQVCPVTSV